MSLQMLISMEACTSYALFTLASLSAGKSAQQPDNKLWDGKKTKQTMSGDRWNQQKFLSSATRLCSTLPEDMSISFQAE